MVLCRGLRRATGERRSCDGDGGDESGVIHGDTFLSDEGVLAQPKLDEWVVNERRVDGWSEGLEGG